MAFTVPTLDEIHADLIADYAGRFPDDDVSKFSDNWKRLRVTAGALLGVHAHIDSSHEDLLEDGATETALDRLLSINGLTRKPATPAKKADALRVTGSEGSALTTGDELVHADGTRYRVNETTTIPAAGYKDVDVLALDVGSKTRKQVGEILTFVSAPAGVNSAAELQLDIDEDGDDREEDGPAQARLLARRRSPAMGGNAEDYRQWAEAVTGVASAYVFPLRQGLGTVGLAALHTGSGSVRLLTSDERAEVQAYIDARRPIGVAQFRVLEVTAKPTDVELAVTVFDDSAYAFDWDDSTAPMVYAWDAGTRKLTFTSSRPSSMDVGMRLVVRNTSTWNNGAECLIEALDGADAVILAEAPDEEPEGGALVFSGGAVVEPLRKTIIALMDGFGPARGDFAAGKWEGTLRLSSLYKLGQGADGVQDTEIIAPGANVEGANAAPAPTVEVLTPRQIIVRRAW